MDRQEFIDSVHDAFKGMCPTHDAKPSNAFFLPVNVGVPGIQVQCHWLRQPDRIEVGVVFQSADADLNRERCAVWKAEHGFARTTRIDTDNNSRCMASIARPDDDATVVPYVAALLAVLTERTASWAARSV